MYLTKEFLDSINAQNTPQSIEQLLQPYFTNNIYLNLFNSNVRNFFRLPEEVEVFEDVLYPLAKVDRKYNFYVRGNFECMSINIITMVFAIQSNSELFNLVKSWTIPKSISDEYDSTTIEVIPVAVLPLLIQQMSQHPLHYLIRRELFQNEDTLKYFRKKLEILVLSNVWMNHYASEITLMYQERFFDSKFIVDATIYLQDRRLFLEVNEKGHRNYDKELEINRHDTIKTVGMNVICFDGTGSTYNNVNKIKLDEFLENVDAGIQALSDIKMDEFESIVNQISKESQQVGQAFQNILGKTLFSSGFPLTESDIKGLNPSLNNNERAWQRLINKFDRKDFILSITRGELYSILNKIHDSNDSSEYFNSRSMIWIFREEVVQIAFENRIELQIDDVYEQIEIKINGNWTALPLFNSLVSSTKSLHDKVCRVKEDSEIELKTSVSKKSKDVIFKTMIIGGSIKKIARFSRLFLYNYLIFLANTNKYPIAKMLADSIMQCYDKIPKLIAKLKSDVRESRKAAEETYRLGIKKGIKKGEENKNTDVIVYQQKNEILEIKIKNSKDDYTKAVSCIDSLNLKINLLEREIEGYKLNKENQIIFDELNDKYNVLLDERNKAVEQCNEIIEKYNGLIDYYNEVENERQFILDSHSKLEESNSELNSSVLTLKSENKQLENVYVELSNEHQTLMTQVEENNKEYENYIFILTSWYTLMYERMTGIKLKDEILAPPFSEPEPECKVRVIVEEKKEEKKENSIRIKYPWLPSENISYSDLKRIFDTQGFPKKFTFKQFTNELIENGIEVRMVKRIKIFIFET